MSISPTSFSLYANGDFRDPREILRAKYDQAFLEYKSAMMDLELISSSQNSEECNLEEFPVIERPQSPLTIL